jgi:hypothetical protein
MATCRVAAYEALTTDHLRREIEFISAGSECQYAAERETWAVRDSRSDDPVHHREPTVFAVATCFPSLMRAMIQGKIGRRACQTTSFVLGTDLHIPSQGFQASAPESIDTQAFRLSASLEVFRDYRFRVVSAQ